MAANSSSDDTHGKQSYVNLASRSGLPGDHAGRPETTAAPHRAAALQPTRRLGRRFQFARIELAVGVAIEAVEILRQAARRFLHAELPVAVGVKAA